MSDEQRNLLKESDTSIKWREEKASQSNFRKFVIEDGLFRVVLCMGDVIYPRSWSVHFHDLRISQKLECSFGCDPEKAQKEAAKVIKDAALEIIAFAIQL